MTGIRLQLAAPPSSASDFAELMLGEDRSTPYVARTDKTKVVRLTRISNGIIFFRRVSDDEMMKAPQTVFHAKYVRMEGAR